MEKIKESCTGSSYKLLMDNTMLVDLREQEEFDNVKFDVPNILHIPYGEFEKRYQEIPKDNPVIIASSFGEKGEKATRFLMEKGYTNVSNMTDGLSKWLYKRYPILGDKFFTLVQD